jgi:hypothetical protein
MYNKYAPDVNTIESVVSGRRVFVGNQPDDFALAGWLAPGDRISLVGLGYGGAVRSILAVAPDARLVGVENDAKLAALCDDYFSSYFSGISLSVVTVDARRYLQESMNNVDAICVDIYDDAGYPDFVFESDFWNSVLDALRPRGVVFINCWGLPGHLVPWTPPSPLPNLAHTISTSFPEMRYLKNRRNVTLVASVAPLRPLPRRPIALSASLSRQDRIIAECLAVRWNSSDAATSRLFGKPEPGQSLRLRTDINAEMYRRWQSLPSALGSDGTDVSDPRHFASVRDFLSSPDSASQATLEMLARGAAEADFLPIAAAASHFEGHADISDWYGPWVIEKYSEVTAINQRWFWGVALWQALCIVAYPFSDQPHWTDTLLEFSDKVVSSYYREGASDENFIRDN